jgi:hypothetical protein
MDKNISPSIYYDVTKEQLGSDLTDIFNSDTTLNNLPDLIKLFPNDRISIGNKLEVININKREKVIVKTTNLKDLLDVYLIMKKKFPNEITGDLKIEKNNWSGNWYINMLLGICGWICTTLVLNVYYETKRGVKSLNESKAILSQEFLTTMTTWQSDEENKISNSLKEEIVKLTSSVNQSFIVAIYEFYKAHKGFIHGIYDNYPHNYTQIFNDDIFNFATIREGKRGLYIWMKGVGEPAYSELAQNLLKISSICVKSTSFYNNIEFKDLLETGVLNTWLGEVNNKKVRNKSFSIKRVHVFNNKYEEKSLDKFIELLNLNSQAKEQYKSLYVMPVLEENDYRIWQLTEADKFFFGEYIIFDNQIMIKYDKDFCLLELFVGSIVKELSSNFEIADLSKQIFDYKGKENILSALDL